MENKQSQVGLVGEGRRQGVHRLEGTLCIAPTIDPDSSTTARSQPVMKCMQASNPPTSRAPPSGSRWPQLAVLVQEPMDLTALRFAFAGTCPRSLATALDDLDLGHLWQGHKEDSTKSFDILGNG